MGGNPKYNVCFISTFLPQQCGIANFTNDLINAVTTVPSTCNVNPVRRINIVGCENK